MEVAINSSIYRQAQSRAQEQGLSLTTVIENFLLRFVSKSDTQQEVVPDVVLSLLGAAEPTNGENKKEREETYYQYLEEKYK